MNRLILEALSYFKDKDWESTLRLIEEIENEEIYDQLAIQEAEYLAALSLVRLGRLDEAQKKINSVILKSPDKQRVNQCRLILAWIYTTTSKITMAEYELGKIINNVNPLLKIKAMTAYAYTAYKQGRPQEALRWYAKVLDRDPENATALNGMSYILASDINEYEKALELIKQALDKDPNNPYYLDTYAWILLSCGREKDAYEAISKATELAPNEKEILNHFKKIEEIIAHGSKKIKKGLDVNK